MEFDILSSIENATTLHLEANSIKSLKSSSIQRFGVRRFENGKLYQSSRLGEANESRLINDTKEWGGPGVPHDYGFAPAREEVRTAPEVRVDFFDEFEEAAAMLPARHPNFVFNGKCTVSNGITSLHSSYGLNLKASGGICEWYVMYQRKNSGNMFDGFIAESSLSPGIRNALDGHAEYLAAQTHEASLKPGRIPVLFADTTAPLKKLIESILVHRYREGSCLYAGRLGETLFSPQVTLLDRAYIPQCGQNQFFDGEGTVRESDDHVLIDKGCFSSLLADLRFGKRFTQPSTGNGVRSYSSGVSLAPRMLSFKNGEKPWREVVQGLDRCLVAVIAAGGDSNDLGELSSPVQIGYVFEKGRLVGRAPQVTVKASLTDYLGKDLIAIANDGFMPNSVSPSVISEMDLFVH